MGEMSIGSRFKQNYEAPAKHLLTRRVPVIVRIDGRAFHTFTRGLDKPFDAHFMASMVGAARFVADNMQGFKIAFVQSDEASFLLTDYDGLSTDPWFGYVKSKVETVAASSMTAAFMSLFGKSRRLPMFDARAFNVPREEVVNYFLWRSLDWRRNSVSMYCRSVVGPKAMLGKGRADQHDLLHAAGKSWATDLSDHEKNGAWLTGAHWRSEIVRDDLQPRFEELREVIDPLVNCDHERARSEE